MLNKLKLILKNSSNFDEHGLMETNQSVELQCITEQASDIQVCMSVHAATSKMRMGQQLLGIHCQDTSQLPK